MSVNTPFLTSYEKHIIDALSIAAMVGSLVDYLPHVAAVFTIVWTGLRIWQEPPIQKLFKRKPPDTE